MKSRAVEARHRTTRSALYVVVAIATFYIPQFTAIIPHASDLTACSFSNSVPAH